MSFWWISCKRFTIGVYTNPDGIITATAPIAQRFIGQPIANLIGWTKTFPGAIATAVVQSEAASAKSSNPHQDQNDTEEKEAQDA